MILIMRERSPGNWIPVKQIEDWRIGGQADRPYDDPEQAAADILSLLGQPNLEADESQASSSKTLPIDETADSSS